MGGIKLGIGFGGFSREIPDVSTFCAYAERAEELGIDSIWLSDHSVSRQPSFDIHCLMAAIAVRTKKLKMGPSVLTMPTRHPIHVAKTYATLDYLTGGTGRVILGVGIGASPRESECLGVGMEERGARLAEGVAVLRRLWTEERVCHEGRFWKFRDVTLEPRPARGALDIWIGGNSEMALKRVARYGDGWLPSFVTPVEFADGMAKLVQFGAERNRTIDPREAGVLLLTHVEDDPAKLAAVVQKFTAKSPFPLESFSSRAAIGSVTECIARIRAYVAAGCTKFVLHALAAPDQLVSQVERIGTKVLPEIAP